VAPHSFYLTCGGSPSLPRRPPFFNVSRKVLYIHSSSPCLVMSRTFDRRVSHLFTPSSCFHARYFFMHAEHEIYSCRWACFCAPGPFSTTEATHIGCYHTRCSFSTYKEVRTVRNPSHSIPFPATRGILFVSLYCRSDIYFYVIFWFTFENLPPLSHKGV
jgi:hypothetical protein